MPGPGEIVAKRRRSSGGALRNWRVRSRLMLLVLIPMLSATALGSAGFYSSVNTAFAYQRVENLATLGQRIVSLANALEDERDQTAVYVAMPSGGRGDALKGTKAGANAAAGQRQVVAQAQDQTNTLVNQVQALASQIGGSYSAQVQQAVSTARTALDELGPLRTVATQTQIPALAVITQYTGIINHILAVNDQIGQAASDPALAQTVRALGLVTAMQEEASQQRAIVAAALWRGYFEPGELSALTSAQASQQSNLSQFFITASLDQQNLWNTGADNSFAYLAISDANQAVALQTSKGSLTGIQISPVDYYGAMSSAVDVQMGSVEQSLVGTAVDRAGVLRHDAIINALEVGAAVLVTLLVSLLLASIIARSMVRPLRRLRTGALEVAGVRLPETVRRMSESDSEQVLAEIEPIDVDSTDEIGEVARAFDQVHREAVRLAANEASLRGSINAMFVNLSRRSQSLVERQIRLIDELEQGEQDAERLGSLFAMDHLATRMRRNSENLLVLAGHESTRRWNQPVPLVDVLRAAISEIEQYERVSLNVQPGISIRGAAVNDVVHLIAELAENATSFSSAETPVAVSGHLLSTGGVLLDITDRGVGMGAEEMAHANWRLDNPPVVDVAVSRRMGLFVVARLAARHGIRVRLRPGPEAGLTALVWLPDEVVVNDGAGASPPTQFGDSASRGLFSGSSVPTEMGGRSDIFRSAAEQEVSASRAPRFASLNADGNGAALGVRRVPGVGPHPGRAGGPGEADGFPVPPLPQAEPEVGRSESAPFDSGPFQTGPFGTGSFGGGSFGTGSFPARPDDPAQEPSAGSGLFTRRQYSESEDTAQTPGAAYGFTGPGTGQQPGPAPLPGSVQPQQSQPQPPPPARQPIAPEPVRSSEAVLGAPVSGSQVLDSTFRTQEYSFRTPDNGVVVPPAPSLREENRLPIFEAVESDWFRRGRPSVEWQQGQRERQPVTAAWSSAADEGWKAAEAAAAPTAGGVTAAGLPRRVPRANLIPGTAAEERAPAPTRSAAATRDRFASLQRGVRQGRAAGRPGATDNDHTDER